MSKKGFTLIELSIVLTIIGLMIGGSFKVMKMMRERAKIAEAKEQVLSAKNAVFGYGAKEYYLPLNSEFDANLSTSKDSNHPIFYTADNNLRYDDICAFTSTSLQVNNKGSVINNVAFVVAHEGVNYNLQTGLDANNTVNIYTPSTKKDDNLTIMNNVNHEYDDIVEWVTLDQLKNEIGCVDKPFRFITDKLPSGKVGVQYPSTSGTAKLEVENNESAATISCSLKSGSPNLNIDFNSSIDSFEGEANASGITIFECNATVDNANANNQKDEIAKKFSITIDPNYNKETNATCTSDAECGGGFCVNSKCSSGIVGDSCVNGGDCASGFCVGGICTTGAFDANCTSGGDCKSGICYGGVCGGAIGSSCSSSTQCLSGYCDGISCALMPSGDSNGTGGGSCVAQNGSCTNDADCCSLNCNPQGKCVGK